MNELLELKQLADECFAEAIQRIHEGKLKVAEEMAIRAKEIYADLEDKRMLSLALNLMSIIYDELGNSSLDLQCLLDALEISLDENAYDVSSKLYNNLGSRLMYVKSYNRALFYFENALDMFNKAEQEHLNDESDVHSFNMVLNMNLSTIYCHMGEYDRAKYYYEIAKNESTHPVNEEMQFAFQSFEGLLLWKIGEKEKATLLVPNIMESAEKNVYTTDYMEVISDFIELLKEKGDYTNWEKVLILVDEHQDDDIGLYIQIEKLKRWLEFYRETGNREKFKEFTEYFYDLSVKKEVQDYELRADTIELNTQMRRAMRQKKLSDSIVYLDPLTGIGNRNKMLEDSKKYIAESAEKRSTIAIGLIDIDFFKECNDTYGHIEGDKCIKKVADIIKEAVGESGNVYRYGGDEFLILLPRLEVEEINNIGLAIKTNLEAAMIKNEKSPIVPYVTVSQGYTRAIADEGDTIDHLVNLADRVLYSVKRFGRNDYKYMLYQDIVIQSN